MTTLMQKVRGWFNVKSEALTPDNFPDVQQQQIFQYTGSQGLPEQVSTYFACIRNIAEDISKLPIFVLDREGDSRVRNTDSRLQRLLMDPTFGAMTPFVFRSTLLSYALSWGNGYARIFRDNAFRPIGMLIYPTWRIEPYICEDGEKTHMMYKIKPKPGTDQKELMVPEEDMIHIKGMGDGWVGYSMVQLMANTLSLAGGATKYANYAMSNGATPGGIITHPAKLSKEAHARLRESWEMRHQGSQNAGRIAILEEGMTFNPITASAKDVQFLETSKFQVEEICRWFRMPPPKVQDLGRATWGNLEPLNTEYVQDCLTPWAVRIEQEFKMKLVYTPGRSIKHEFNALLRGDQKTRGEFYNKMFMIGALSPNDIRRLEDMDPVEGGDEHFVPLNMVSLNSPMRDMAENTVERFARKETKALAGSINSDFGKAEVFYKRHIEQMETDLKPVAIAFQKTDLKEVLEAQYNANNCLLTDSTVEDRKDAVMKYLTGG